MITFNIPFKHETDTTLVSYREEQGDGGPWDYYEPSPELRAWLEKEIGTENDDWDWDDESGKGPVTLRLLKDDDDKAVLFTARWGIIGKRGSSDNSR